MIRLRRSAERGRADHGWLQSRHTFSFADYHDPAFMGFRSLRVINEDWVQPSKGFPTHSHRDMEIVTWVLDGALEHKDSMGNGSVIRPGEAQLMRAGTGVTHSEYNQSSSEPVHLLQIWILPEREGLTPAYEQKEFPVAERRNRLRPIVAAGGVDGALPIRQDTTIYASVLDAGAELTHGFAPGRFGWVQIARGSVRIDDAELAQGDAAAIGDEASIRISSAGGAELLLFDLA
jgi:quercetin 2,3-dioxygenase